MKITRNGDILNVSDIQDLGTRQAEWFRSTVTSALGAPVREIDIDLGGTRFADCAGLGALISILNSARRDNSHTIVRLLNPNSQVRRLFELAHLGEAFPINSQTGALAAIDA